jgi:hypothetical protein
MLFSADFASLRFKSARLEALHAQACIVLVLDLAAFFEDEGRERGRINVGSFMVSMRVGKTSKLT